MSLRDLFSGLFGSGRSVNPATGLPMMGGAVDVQGNPYGTDLHRHHVSIGASAGCGSDDHHRHGGFENGWSSSAGSAGSFDSGWSSSSQDVASSWPDHAAGSDGGYDPFRGW